MYSRYDALIFDMDGTLLDTESLHKKAWIQVLNRYGMTYDEQEIIKLYGSPSFHIARVFIESQTMESQKDLLDPMVLAEEKNLVFRSLIQSDIHEVRALPLVSVVKEWHGRKPMAVGTGTEREVAESLLTKLALRPYFSAIVGADDVKKHKPEPETFLRCAEILGVQPEKCLVFEDADFGLRAARAAGMDAIDVRLS